MKLNSILLIAVLSNLVLCGNIFSQSTFFLGQNESSPELIYQNNNLHGYGINKLSNFGGDSTLFQRACESSLIDLNSNLFISVFIEEFKSNDQSLYNFPEFSIRDTVLSLKEGGNIVQVDSFVVDRNVHCITGINNGAETITAPMPPLEDLMTSPQRVGDTWFAIGKARKTNFNPSIAWMKAKNDAVQELTKVLKTSVQSITQQYETDERVQMEEFTYFKSNILYRDVYNIRRYTTNISFITVIAVKHDDVMRY
ncbi:MAG: hypothetical protein CL670_06420 [Balneola sp.]|nr:hypothetical protein [Balneola sp.]MBE78772.1 hypothetical protein [Balneola sp.]